MRITRRDFMKYCAAAAGALGLTTTDLVKLEKALATPVSLGGTQVVWLNGAACTGCTVSFANSAYYSSIQDLLVPWASVGIPAILGTYGGTTAALVTAINSGVLTDTGANGALDLVFMETLNSAVGFNAVNAAHTARDGSNPYVLCIEGSIQTASDGNYCTIGSGTAADDTATISFMDEVREYATNSNCLAVMAVGACASFGGIPGAKGSVTDAKGLISTGKISGGYRKVDDTGLWDYLKGTAEYEVTAVSLTNPGSSYTTATVSFGGPGTGAAAYADITGGQLTAIHVTSGGTGYTSAPIVTIGGDGTGAGALASIGVVSGTGISNTQWIDLMRKTVCVSGCPPHPDWIVGTIVYILTYGEPPLTDKWHRPFDFYQEYQCTNCLWQTNQPGTSNVNNQTDMKNIDGTLLADTTKGGVTKGNSPKLYKSKYDSIYEGCLGVMGCKGRKTKADCSYRRWNSDKLGKGGVSWCVQTRAGCHGCTDPRFPDGWGKFFSFK